MNLSELPVYSVSQVNGYLKRLMDGDGLLGRPAGPGRDLKL